MPKMLTVAKHEFLSNLKQRSFLFSAFGIPIFIVIVWIVIFTVAADEGADDLAASTVGYVDQAGILADPVEQPENFTAYETEEAAQAAMDDETISMYFVVSEDYLSTGRISVYSFGTAPDALQDVIESYLLANLVEQNDIELSMDRLQNPTDMTVVIQDSGRELRQEAIIGLILTPMVFVMVFMMASQITSGYLMSGIVEEKSNRIMEILITSITPMQMLAGKLIGLGLLGLLQMAIWLAVGLVVIGVSGDNPILSGIQLPPDLIALVIVYFILSYFLLASFMAAIGVVIGSEQESRQYAGIFSLVLVLPFFFIVQFLENPNGTLPVILSLVPFTAGISVLLRSSFSSVPFEQIVISIGILLTSTVFITWAAAKIFRWASLRYGQKASLGELLRVLRGRAEIGTVATPETVKEG